MLTQDYLKKVVKYDFESGEIFWLKRPLEHFKNESSCNGWNKKYSGKKAVTLDGKGYRVMNIDGKRYLVHRLAWLYTYGEWPKVIDHCNGVKTDNRISNLVNGSIQQNHLNMRKAKNNTSGVTGVYLNTKRNLWCAQIKFKGKTRHLGSSKDFEGAVEIRKAEEKRLGFSVRHGSD